MKRNRSIPPLRKPTFAVGASSATFPRRCASIPSADTGRQDAAERAFNNLVRSYAAQMETLKRYRSKGQQVVRVERVTVADGGQAIVGNVNQRGAGDE